MPRRRGDKPFSGCKATCLHRSLVEDYYSARDEQEIRAEAVTRGYATERRAYFGRDGHAAVEEQVTFKFWLRAHTGGDWASRDRLKFNPYST